MDIGIAKEIKAQEGRVAFLPDHVSELIQSGHNIFVETGAGDLSGASDRDYQAAGAKILQSGKAVYGRARMIVKVKEILPEEYDFLEPGQIIYTNLHSASNRELTDVLLDRHVTGISAEDTHEFGSPNCALAGELGAFEGVRLCFSPHGGLGRHFTGHFGSEPITAVVMGLGLVGQGALRTLLRLGCNVIGLDIQKSKLYHAGLHFEGENFKMDTVDHLADYLPGADLIINCVLWPKHRDDHLIDRNMLRTCVKAGAVICDISCDTAGAIETTRSTTWDDPTYIDEGVTHFCVDNIPGSVPVTASQGYGNAILPFVRLVAEKGVLEACREQSWLARGLTSYQGQLILPETGRVQNRPVVPLQDILQSA